MYTYNIDKLDISCLYFIKIFGIIEWYIEFLFGLIF